MNKEKLKNFIELITFDQQSFDLERKIQSLQADSLKIQKQIDHHEIALHQARNKRHDVIKLLHEQELQLKQSEVEEDRLNESSKNVRNVKEFDAAQKELDMVKQARFGQEQKIVQLTNKVELATKELEAFEIKYQLEHQALLQKLQEQKDLIQEFEKALSNLQSEREKKFENIPADWLQTYENMRGRVQNPVVSLNHESCSACFSFISSRDLQLLRQFGLLQCKECYRFLYIDDSSAE